MRGVSCVPDQLNKKKKQTMVWGCRGSRGSRWAVELGRRVGRRQGEGSGRRRSGVRSSQQRMEERSGAELREFVITNVGGGDKELLRSKAGGGMMQTRKNIITHTEFKTSLIKALQLGFSVTIHIFLDSCLHFYQRLKSTPTWIQAQVKFI